MALKQWISCDGRGGLDYSRVSRRRLFLTAGLSTLSWLSSKTSALAQLAVRPSIKESQHTLVVIFLRGGADGLNIVAPYGEDAYYRLRPTLALAKPKDKSTKTGERVLDLNGFFGMHPALGGAYDLFRNGKLSVVHGCGSFDNTHSHFDAMSTMERGLSTSGDSVSSGWLARHLNSCPGPDSPLRAVAFGNVLPDSLRGVPGAVSLESLADYRLEVDPDHHEKIAEALADSYRAKHDELTDSALGTLEAVRRLNNLDPKTYKPRDAVQYPSNDIGQGLKQVAMLIRANVGLEVACLDKGGWDTHVAQGSSTGWQANLLGDLSSALAAFAADMGPDLNRVTTLAMTEFGRRAYENTGLGTDHGHASCMFLMGGAVKGGHVFGNWPGLEAHQLEEPGDLKVTTDYRNVLAEVLNNSMGNRNVESVFPGLHLSYPGISAL